MWERVGKWGVRGIGSGGVRGKGVREGGREYGV